MIPKNIIVDCDAGIDDALALIILLTAHKKKEVIVKAITCVNGNTTVDNVVKNVFRTLEVCHVTDVSYIVPFFLFLQRLTQFLIFYHVHSSSCQIPVYRGAYSALLDTPNARDAAAELYHGTDGFGDVYTDEPDTSKLQQEHAVYVLHNIVSKDPGN